MVFSFLPCDDQTIVILLNQRLIIFLTGNEIFEPGRPCGNGLTENAAREMGLAVGTPVATSLIDAHAGGLGMIGVGLKNPTEFKHRLGEYYIHTNYCVF